MRCALCDVAVAAGDVVLLGGHVVCQACRLEVHADLTPAEFPEDWPSADRMAAGVRRRVSNRREEAAMRLQGSLAL
ncbi:MAG: hypothetical protein CVU47_06450 [Chloroflexi bacterium HGW-Chloroflexi-9]|nr:MAG: hypothetical protein CVU47_06450 [Chloroflexi bacterium HGW-Chloroflexi-9]